MGRGLLLLLEANAISSSYLRSNLAIADGPMCFVAVAVVEFEAEELMCLMLLMRFFSFRLGFQFCFTI